MIIDFHTHVFPKEIIDNRQKYIERDAWFATCYGNPRAKMADAETLVASMVSAGIDLSVVCGFCWRDAGLCAYHNDYLIEVARIYGDRLVGFAIIPPSGGESAVAELERCLAGGLRGVGEVNADAQGFALTDVDRLEPFVQALVKFDVPLLLHVSEPVGHVYPGKGSAFPEIVYRFIARYPELRLVCAHWGGGLPFYELMPEVAEAARNVCYDTSASSLLYRPDIVKVVPPIVGSDKVVFGTDYPLLRQDRLLTIVRNLGLDHGVLDGILGANAIRLLKYG